MRPRTAASCAAAIAAAAGLLAGRAPAVRPSPAPATPPASDAPDPVQRPLPLPSRAVPLEPLTPSSPPADTVLLHGTRPERHPSSTERLLATWSADELALFARVELLTGRSPSPGVLALVRQRRAGAAPEALRAAAADLLAGDPLARAAALEWARTTAWP